jgi:hypothetical protein
VLGCSTVVSRYALRVAVLLQRVAGGGIHVQDVECIVLTHREPVSCQQNYSSFPCCAVRWSNICMALLLTNILQCSTQVPVRGSLAHGTTPSSPPGWEKLQFYSNFDHSKTRCTVTVFATTLQRSRNAPAVYAPFPFWDAQQR